MPYITTTRSDKGAMTDAGWRYSDTSHAVATLDEARRYVVENLLADHGPDPRDQVRVDAAWSLPESGGTIGPLPDGTVIEVRPMVIRPDEIRADETHDENVRRLVDAYNNQ